MSAYFETGFPLPKALTKEFTRQYPNVKWDIRQDQFAVITQNAPLTLSGPNAPDLMRLPQMSGLVHDHLLKNLDGYAKSLGWDKWPASQLEQLRVASDGTRGTGSLYAVGLNFSMTGVFYNKKLAAKVGMTGTPQTLAQLDALLAKAKAAGITPIVQFNGGATGGLAVPAAAPDGRLRADRARSTTGSSRSRAATSTAPPTSRRRSTCSSGSRPATSTRMPTPPTTRR